MFLITSTSNTLYESIALYYFSIFFYIISFINIFLILFSVRTRVISTLEAFKFLHNNRFYYYSLIITLLSLAGIPPFLGFFLKTMQLILIIAYNHSIIFFFFICFNSVSLYFYSINLKYIIDEKTTSVKDLEPLRLNPDKRLHGVIMFINFLNVMGIFLIDSFMVFFYFLASSIGF